MTTINLPIVSNKRECGTCTKCCEGWLHATIRGHDMYVGKPCFFIEQGVGCKDYEGRPENPCKGFECGWKLILEMPEEFKPEISGVIIQYVNGYWSVIKSPNNPDAKLLSWIITYATGNNQAIVWYIDDRVYWIGNDEFSSRMRMEHEIV